MNKTLITKWESVSGKYWVKLYTDRFGATYTCDNGGGNLGNITVIEALLVMQKRIDSGEFLPDKAKQRMKRVL